MIINEYRELYRIELGREFCRSTEALATSNMLAIDGVEAAVTTEQGTLLVLSSGERNVFDSVVRAAVESGLDPGSLRVSPLERVFDPTPLSIVDAERLGLVSAPKEPVRAVLETVQRIRVSVTDGYEPDTILIDAGVPAEIEFSEGHGCLGKVVFDALGIEADLENGGAVLRIPALEPGTYPFRCGMDMVHGTLIAE